MAHGPGDLPDGGWRLRDPVPHALLGVPNASLGMLLYVALAAGLLLDMPAWLLFVMTLPAVGMSAFLGWSLYSRRLQCRICWAGHAANLTLALLLARQAFVTT